MLRDYQRDAHDAVIDWVSRSIEPCLVEAATGAGKSHIIAAIAATLFARSGKHILCLAPSAELVEQNREKYLLTGNPASIFSASLGVKDLRHPVVFGTPLTVANMIGRFGSRFCAVVIDEAHGITPTVMQIVDSMRGKNPNLRVIGLTATPYRMGSGYIFRIDETGNPVPQERANEPYFTKLVSRIRAKMLIDRGYLTQPVVGSINTSGYTTEHLKLDNMGRFNPGDVDRAFVGQGRKTALIIADIIEQSRDKMGVMIFAATVRHAQECIESLPPGLSAIVTGETKKKERREIIAKFKERRIKYLVNVAVLTTGFDATHVDVVALMRATESVGLLQQIVGRGLRKHDEKEHCLVLDYAQNIQRHCPDEDIFTPDIKARAKGELKMIDVVCPSCKITNKFAARKNNEGFRINDQGYFIDLDGEPVMTNDKIAIPGHMGRRCQAFHLVSGSGGKMAQCSHRWSSKECESCGAENDIAARYCESCSAEIIDPNEKLLSEFKERKKDPSLMQCDEIASMSAIKTMSMKGNECLRVTFFTPFRRFTVWYLLNGGPDLQKFLNATQGGRRPATVKYAKEKSGFYRVYSFDEPADKAEVAA